MDGPRRPGRRSSRRRDLGGPVRPHRWPALPSHHRLEDVLRCRCAEGTDRRTEDLGRRTRYLGRGRARCGGRVDRRSSARHPPARLRRRHRAADPVGTGDRSPRQLLQPGALRTRDHTPVGPGDLRTRERRRVLRPRTDRRRVQRRRGRGGPSDLPLRAAVERAHRRAPGGRRPVLPHRARPVVRALRRGLLPGPVLHRIAARRPRGRRQRHRGHPTEPLHRGVGVPRRRRLLRGRAQGTRTGTGDVSRRPCRGARGAGCRRVRRRLVRRGHRTGAESGGRRRGGDGCGRIIPVRFRRPGSEGGRGGGAVHRRHRRHG